LENTPLKERRGCEDNIKIDLRETGYEDGRCMSWHVMAPISTEVLSSVIQEAESIC
jgi:hypothetical protein